MISWVWLIPAAMLGFGGGALLVAKAWRDEMLANPPERNRP